MPHIPNSLSNGDAPGNSIPAVEVIESALVARGNLPAQIEEVAWLADYARSQRITSFAKLGREVGCDASTISRVFRGTYEADLASFCTQIRHFREVFTERQEFGDEPYLSELSVVKRIAKFCDLVRLTRQIGIIWGPNQSGKSEALKYYATNNEMTAYAALPAGGGTVESMKEVAQARGGISIRKSHSELRDMLLKRFNPQWLLIVDEFHQTIMGRTIKKVTIDRVREFNDRSKCGVVLCGTDVVPNMMQDPKFTDFLGQINNRGVLRMRIPPAPTKADRDLIMEAYDFGAPEAESALLVKQIANENGISKLIDYCNITRQIAAKAHERPSWKHFLTTHDTLTSWAKGEFGK